MEPLERFRKRFTIRDELSLIMAGKNVLESPKILKMLEGETTEFLESNYKKDRTHEFIAGVLIPDFRNAVIGKTTAVRRHRETQHIVIELQYKGLRNKIYRSDGGGSWYVGRYYDVIERCEDYDISVRTEMIEWRMSRKCIFEVQLYSN